MISEKTTRLLLVRSGGRCAVCYGNLLDSAVTWKQLYLGQRAHIVGRTTGQHSPRGNFALEVTLRNEPDNLMLLCGTCHDDFDQTVNLDVLTVERLREIKRAHEDRIEQLLAVPPGNKTTVLRMQGTVGASGVHIDGSVAAATVLQANRYARFPLSPDKAGLEIDLRRVAAANPGNVEYYATCQRIIDQFFDRQFAPAVEDGSIQHLSIFSLARWPLLVYLGAQVGDKIDTDIYQRHRSSESWAWPDGGKTNQFVWNVVAGGNPGDAVLVLSLSATVEPTEVPDALAHCSVYRVAPAGDVTPHYDVVATPQGLKFVEKAFREVLADIERNRKQTMRLHVLGAAPLSACVSLGRAITRSIHPQLILYDRVDGIYRKAMEVD